MHVRFEEEKVMFSRVTLEECLKSVEHKVAADKYISLDDIKVHHILDDDHGETYKEMALDKVGFIDLNLGIVTIPKDFNDKQEVLI